MARRSLVQRCEMDRVLKAHNCQASEKHRLIRGDPRLKVYVDRSKDHYCIACAIKIVEGDIAKLNALLEELRAELRSPTPPSTPSLQTADL